MARAPYDAIAERFAAARTGFRERARVDACLDLVTPGGRVLDLGCGCGEPIMRHALDRGFRVTGVDRSRRMLALARARCPAARLLQADLCDLRLRGRSDGAVAWDSLFHVPRERHGELFERVASWLVPGAPWLLSLGGSEGDFTAPMLGTELAYSAHDPALSRELLERAGFEVHTWEVDDPSSRGHLAILAVRR